MSNYSNFDIEFLENNKWGFPRFDFEAEDNPAEYFKTRFQDKKSYLEWRQKWREGYKELSKQIRYAKNNRSPYRMTDDTYSYHEWQWRASIGRKIANRMMKYLELGKAQAAILKARRLELEMEAA